MFSCSLIKTHYYVAGKIINKITDQLAFVAGEVFFF